MSISFLTQIFMLAGVVPVFRYVLGNGATSETRRSGSSPLSFIVLVSGVLSVIFALLMGGRAVGGLALGLGTTLSLLHPVAAVSFLVNNLILRPWELIPSNSFLLLLPKALALVAFVSFGISMVRRNLPVLRWNRMVALFAAFCGWLVFASLFSFSPSASLDYLSQGFLPVVVTVFLISNCFENSGDVALLRSVLIVAIAGVLGVALVQSGGPGAASSVDRLHGPGMWGNANDLASLIVFVLPFVFLRQASPGEGSSSLSHRIIRIAYILMLMMALWSTQSRGAMIALVASAGVYFIFCTDLKIGKFKTLAIMVIVPIIFLTSLNRNTDELETSKSARWNYAIAGVRMAIDHPVFGVGANNYPRFYERYTPAFDEWGERTAHSSWVLILAETGLIGFLLFAALFMWTFKTSWQLRVKHPELLVALVGYGLVMTFLSHSYNLLPYLLIVVVLITARTSHRSGQLNHLAVVLIAPLLIFAASGEAIAEFKQPGRLYGVSNGDKPGAGYTPELEKEIEIYGSRGEVVNYLIKLDHDAECSKWKVKFPGDSSQSLKSKLYYLPAIEIKNPSYPGAKTGAYVDPALPVTNDKLCPEKTHKGWIWAELHIPADAIPGTYTGGFTFAERYLPVSVQVWPMKMPEKFSFPGYSELTTWFNLLGHFGKWQDGEGELARKYIDEMVQHRLLPLKSAVKTPSVVKSETLVLDLKDNPTPTMSFNAVALHSRPSWAYFDFPTTAYSDWPEKKVVEYFEAMEETLPIPGRQGRAMIYLWDEPKEDEMPRLARLAKLVKEHSPSVRTMVTTASEPSLDPIVDIYVPIMDYYDLKGHPTPAHYQKLRRQGKEIWWYVSCMSHGCDALVDSGAPDFVIERSSSYIRSIPWIASLYDIDAFLYYSVNNGYQFYPSRDPWENLWDFSGNGDGTLFYPGRAGERNLTEEIPIASIRLKLWREASFDAEYIRWMDELESPPDWWKYERKTLTTSPRKWERDYRKYHQLRKRAGLYLSNLEQVQQAGLKGEFNG